LPLSTDCKTLWQKGQQRVPCASVSSELRLTRSPTDLPLVDARPLCLQVAPLKPSIESLESHRDPPPSPCLPHQGGGDIWCGGCQDRTLRFLLKKSLVDNSQVLPPLPRREATKGRVKPDRAFVLVHPLLTSPIKGEGIFGAEVVKTGLYGSR
jgi:hypothetical protein